MTSSLIKKMRRIGSAVGLALLLGCTTAPFAQREANAQTVVTDDDSQLFYELLVSELAIRRGELEVAAEGYMRATERTDDPRVAERATQLAIYYQQWNDAEKTAKRWLTLDPDAVGAHESLAQIHLRQGNTDGAVEAFGGWIESSSNESETFSAINLALQSDPNLELSYAVATELAELYPEQPLAHVSKARMALAVNDQGIALAAANDALQLDDTLVDALLVKAQVQMSQGQSPDALLTLEMAVTEQPDSLPLQLGYAQLLVESEMYERAGPVLDRAAELSQGDAGTWLRLGLLALTASLNDQAKTYLGGVLEHDPYNERAHFYLGRIADRNNNHDEAIEHYDSVPQGDFHLTSRLRAAELSADGGDVENGVERLRELNSLAVNPELKVQLITTESRILQTADRGDEAIAVLSAGLENYPNNSELLYARALTAERNGNYQQLEEDLAQVLVANPDDAHALNALGYHLVVNNKRLDEAEGLLERASSLEPEDAAIMDSLGWLRFRQNRLEEAKVLLSEAYSLFPDPEIAAHLGEVLWMIGDQTSARSLWDKALAEEPEHIILNEVFNRFVKN